jgi:hypothetical protein
MPIERGTSSVCAMMRGVPSTSTSNGLLNAVPSISSYPESVAATRTASNGGPDQ